MKPFFQLATDITDTHEIRIDTSGATHAPSKSLTRKTLFLISLTILSTFGSEDSVLTPKFSTPLLINDSVLILPPAPDSFNASDSTFILRGTETKKRFAYREKDLISPKQYSRQITLKEVDYQEFPQPWLLNFADPKKIIPLMYWRKGAEFNSEYLRVYRSWPNFFVRNHFEMDYKTGNQFFIGGAALFFQFYNGELIREIKSDREDAFSSFGWSLTAGIPALRFEIRSAPWPLPEYSWHQRRLDHLVEDSTTGSFLKMYESDRSDVSTLLNKSYSTIFKLGVFRYKILMDYDTYTTAVHDFMLVDIPFSFGSWSMGITGGGGKWVPGFRLSFLRLETILPSKFVERLKFSSDPLMASVQFENLNNYYMSLGVRIRVGDFLPQYIKSLGALNE